MDTIDLARIRTLLNYVEVIDLMRDALIANSRGECDTPMPMHIDIAPEDAEVHIKSSYRRGGRYFALKIASTFPRNVERGLATGNGVMLLASAETGEPVAMLADAGHLTDVRTAAVAAVVARELGRDDRVLGIVGTGIQARLQAAMHAEVLDIEKICVWGRTAHRAAQCAADIRALLPRAEVSIAGSIADVSRQARLIVTATASREALIRVSDLQNGTHISAVGSDSAGKEELEPAILSSAALLLADSRRQCERLGELQHAPNEWPRVVEIGEFCQSHAEWDRNGITVADFTGLGVEDLYIAEYCYRAFH